MSMTPEQVAPSPGAPRFIQALVRYRKQVSYALFVVAALLLIIPLWPLIQVKFQLMHLDRWPVVLWGLALTLIALTAAIINLVSEPSPDLGETGQLRVVLLALGGAAGLATALLGFVLPWTVYGEVYTGGFTRWRQSPSALIWPGVALVGGLVLMFVSLQLARGMERTHGVLRRLLYGFNAVLASLLLLMALALLNVLPYSKVPPFDALNRTFNWTASGFFELKPDNKEFLRSLTKPVKVYVLLPQGLLVTRDVESLLENCRGVTPDLSWQAVSRDRERAEMQRLRAEYAVPDALGLLVVYGGDKGESQFIKVNDLTKEDFDRRESTGQYVFTGEEALMKAVQSLVENKKRPTIYFTQGSGELDFNFSRATRGEDVSALRDRLREGDYDTKELRLDVNTRSIPGDATLVVIARPTDKLPDNAIKALRDYVRGKKGKLMVLTDVVTRRSGGMVTTGLEPLLREFNVKVNDDRVLTYELVGLGTGSAFPATFVVARVNPDLDNPISRAFNPGGQPIDVLFDDVRTVAPLQAGPGGKYLAQELLYAVPAFGPWSETDLEANPSALRSKLRDPDNLKLRQEKITDKRLSLAVTVSESKGGGMPRDQFHQNVSKDDEPLMVVFGDADWVSTRWIKGAQGTINYALFTRCVSWLRNRPPIDVPTSEGKARKEYVLKVNDPATVSRMEWLPLGLMFLGVVGLGCGIWVVRRR